jgi:hypothetical protein
VPLLSVGTYLSTNLHGITHQNALIFIDLSVQRPSFRLHFSHSLISVLPRPSAHARSTVINH